MADDLSSLIARLAQACVAKRNADATKLRGMLEIALMSADSALQHREWHRVAVGDLPRRPGVYVISSRLADEHYVGVALDIDERFRNQTFGHLSARNRSRSSGLIASGDFDIYLPRMRNGNGALDHPVSAVDLAREEIETYVAIVQGGGRVLNTLAQIGRIGQTKSPVMVCDCETRTYTFADSTMAARTLTNSAALFAVLHGYQRTAGGFAARWATGPEAELLAACVGKSGIVSGARVTAAVTSAPSGVNWAGEGRSSRFHWTAGPLSSDDCSRLLRYRRHSYAKATNRQTPRFRGVSWDSRLQKWQCRAKTGRGPKELWQVGRREWTELDAAVVREVMIQARGWQSFNSGRYASNAETINLELGTYAFTAW